MGYRTLCGAFEHNYLNSCHQNGPPCNIVFGWAAAHHPDVKHVCINAPPPPSRNHGGHFGGGCYLSLEMVRYSGFHKSFHACCSFVYSIIRTMLLCFQKSTHHLLKPKNLQWWCLLQQCQVCTSLLLVTETILLRLVAVRVQFSNLLFLAARQTANCKAWIFKVLQSEPKHACVSLIARECTFLPRQICGVSTLCNRRNSISGHRISGMYHLRSGGSSNCGCKSVSAAACSRSLV